MSVMSNVPASRHNSRIPIRKPTSPMRVVMKAFFAASAADRRSHQNPISRNEQNPTPSHAAYRSRRLSASTSVSIEAAKSDMQVKYQPYFGSPLM